MTDATPPILIGLVLFIIPAGFRKCEEEGGKFDVLSYILMHVVRALSGSTRIAQRLPQIQHYNTVLVYLRIDTSLWSVSTRRF